MTTSTPDPQPPTAAPDDGAGLLVGHGTSLAAWTVTGGVVLGTLVVCVSMIFQWLPFIVVGVVVMLVGVLAGPVLVRAGYGESVPNREFTGGPRAIR